MFNDKDFMGGMFDFDGNGKTTLDEQYKPTERHTSDIIAVNNDFTTNYVGSVGHVAFGSNVKRIGEENLIRIDYEDYIR